MAYHPAIISFKMSKDNRLRIPSSQGGLVRYFEDEYKSKFMISPHSVVALCIIVGVAVLVLSYIFG